MFFDRRLSRASCARGPVQKLPVRDCKYRVARPIFDLNSQMRGVYLSLDQGWIQYEERYTPLSAARERIRANADKLQSLLSSRLGDFSISPILLDSANTLERGHWLGELLPSMIRALQTDLETIERAITANVRVRQSVLKVSTPARRLPGAPVSACGGRVLERPSRFRELWVRDNSRTMRLRAPSGQESGDRFAACYARS